MTKVCSLVILKLFVLLSVAFSWFRLWRWMKIFFTFCDAVDEDMLMALAHQDYKAGNFKQALENSKAVYQRNPSRTDNLLLLGAVHYQVIVISSC